MSRFDDDTFSSGSFAENKRPSDARWFWVGLLAIAGLLFGIKLLNQPSEPAQGTKTQLAAPGGATLVADSSGSNRGSDVQMVDAPGRPRVVAPRGELDDDENDTINLFRESESSVVFITTIDQGLNRYSHAIVFGHL